MYVISWAKQELVIFTRRYFRGWPVQNETIRIKTIRIKTMARGMYHDYDPRLIFLPTTTTPLPLPFLDRDPWQHTWCSSCRFRQSFSYLMAIEGHPVSVHAGVRTITLFSLMPYHTLRHLSRKGFEFYRACAVPAIPLDLGLHGLNRSTALSVVVWDI